MLRRCRAVLLLNAVNHALPLVFATKQRLQVKASPPADSHIAFSSTAPNFSASANAYPLHTIWTTPDAVRNAPRVYV